MKDKKTHFPDIITQTVIQKALEQICTEMTVVLRRSAYSPNIKERLDFSCALFDSKGESIASKEGIPVHLGSMQESVIASINYFDEPHQLDDIIIHNDPTQGGTHLPDVNLISPIFILNNNTPNFWAACRAHASDIGGKTPGSMPGHSETLFEEGLQIPPIKLWDNGKLQKGVWDLLLANVRTPTERQGDFNAQKAALYVAEKRMKNLCQKYGLNKINQIIEILKTRLEQVFLKFIQNFPLNQPFTAFDCLDSDGFKDKPVKINVTVIKNSNSQLTIDFNGSDHEKNANCNATSAVTRSCVYYVFRYLLSDFGDIPTNAGLWHPLKIILPPNSVINVSEKRACSSGNVETSQRIVDVCFKALKQIPALVGKIPAASQGTMNNISIGELGWTYYETLGGGSGATSESHGANGIHTHMTNTLNTPIEALEISFPLRIHQYQLRYGSGGKGTWDGGNGLIREYELLSNEAVLSLQTERRKLNPYGLFGGKNGKLGSNWFKTANEDWKLLPARCTIKINRNDRIKIITPSGGGYGEVK